MSIEKLEGWLFTYNSFTNNWRAAKREDANEL